MGTRGVYGFHKNGVDKVTYNHYDSYPKELGIKVKEFLTNHTIGEISSLFEKISLVNLKTTPTKEQKMECSNYLDLDVSSQSIDDWYCLLRNSQGDLESYSKGLRYMIDYKDFLKDSLFCEWGYIINIDKEVLEIYRGFQGSPNYNRFFTNIPTDTMGEYYNCQLIKEVPIKDISSFDMCAFEDEIYTNEGLTSNYKMMLKVLQDKVTLQRTYTSISNIKFVKKYDKKVTHYNVDIHHSEKLDLKTLKLIKEHIISNIKKETYQDKVVNIIFKKTKNTTGWKFLTELVIEVYDDT